MANTINYVTLCLCVTFFSKAYSSDDLIVTVRNLNTSITTILTTDSSGPVKYRYTNGDIVEFVCKRSSFADDQPLPPSNILYWVGCRFEGNRGMLGSTKYCFETNPVRKNSNKHTETLNAAFANRTLQCMASGTSDKNTIKLLFKPED